MSAVEILVAIGAAAVALLGLALLNARVAIVATMSAACFTMTWNDVRAAGLTASDFLLFATVFLVVISPVRTIGIADLFRGPLRSLSLYGVILFVASVVGGVLRREPDLALETGIRFLIAILLVVYVVTTLVRERRSWQRYATWYVLGATVSALFAIGPGDQLGGRDLGLTNHPNHLGFTMLLAFFLAVAVQGSPRKIERYAAAFAIPLLVAAIVLSGSRGSLLSLGLGIVALVMMGRIDRIPWLVGFILAAIVAVALLPQDLRSGPTAIGRLLEPTKYDIASGNQRLSLYREAITLIERNPIFGEGFSQAFVFHSVPLQVVIMGGLAGLGALIVLTIAGISAFRFAAARGRHSMTRASGAGLVALAFFLLTEPILFDRYYLFFVAMTFMACSPYFESVSRTTGNVAERKVADPV